MLRVHPHGSARPTAGLGSWDMGRGSRLPSSTGSPALLISPRQLGPPCRAGPEWPLAVLHPAGLNLGLHKRPPPLLSPPPPDSAVPLPASFPLPSQSWRMGLRAQGSSPAWQPLPLASSPNPHPLPQSGRSAVLSSFPRPRLTLHQGLANESGRPQRPGAAAWCLLFPEALDGLLGSVLCHRPQVPRPRPPGLCP